MSTKDNISNFFESLEDKKARCLLCAHRCVISNNSKGICKVRENKNGIIISLNKNIFIALNIDPIEKKPLFHFLPGSKSFSVATEGCNFKCLFCQNHEISQIGERKIRGNYVPSAKIVDLAIANDCQSISYTYTEPTIFFETAYEIGVMARDRSLKNVFVTNGYLTKETSKKSKDFLDAANVDLKCFSEEKYKKYCGATLKGVLQGIDYLLEAGVLIEITTLIVPGFNDNREEFRQIAKFIGSRSKEIPWHISRFFPNYKMSDKSPTPLEMLEMAEESGREEGLKYIYKGNVWGEGEDTFCPNCKSVLIQRQGFDILKNVLHNGVCPHCGERIYGIFS
ncbi:MAG: AmmeMemoRadiSam system radical SAM enzyme [Acidobacteria bacterium]|nr:AmmeMemoRadiSam system radical SAM enzyme [Acidobacteriota bacterium]